MFFFAVSTNERTHTKEIKCFCNVEHFKAFITHDLFNKLHVNHTQPYTLLFSTSTIFFPFANTLY